MAEANVSPEVRPLLVPQTLYYAVGPRPAKEEGLPPLLIALHGWGQNAKRMLRDLAPISAAGVLVVAPQAPHPFYLDMESAKVGFHWLTRYERDRAIADNNAFLAYLLDALKGEEFAFDPGRVFLLGFSQGCSMAWRFAVSGLVAPAGMIACGADLPPDVAEVLPLERPFDVLLVHGREDNIIAPEKMHAAREALGAANVPHAVHEFDGGHEIPGPVAGEIAAWILAR